MGFLLLAAFRHEAGLSSIVSVIMVGNGTMALSSTLSFVLVPERASELIASRGRGQGRAIRKRGKGYFQLGPRERHKLRRAVIEMRLSGLATGKASDGTETVG